ncbi:hypothetical protein H0H81_001438 [Sphagnurus paluster]|uniref:Ubiquitin-like protein ATG12 n=1 Tax=Sphagnurus paluster TaxID=117069 RepID=A0A9P7FPT0_9AGAR|nr:hypothetical protein H0H81_001438 [Sphagnurus paluster]
MADRSLLPWAAPEHSDSFTEASKALDVYKQRDPSKVIVRFKAVGNAPIMKQNFYKITSSNRFQAVIQFLRKELGWAPGEPLFTYVNLAFSPAPDDTVSNLFKVRRVRFLRGSRLSLPVVFDRGALDRQLQVCALRSFCDRG